eukprot:m.85798 g.85798  ORF g.85798 m.85798 type:complete len:134 (-) comp25901_c0_seq1:474-875(-)
MDLFRKIPEPIRFGVSGTIGTGVFWLLNESLVASGFITWQPITVAWFVAYLISIWFQHILNCVLVFGWGDSYIKGLIACYAGYSMALFASVPINYGLVTFLTLSASQAWGGTLILTGMANYFVIGAAMKTKAT